MSHQQIPEHALGLKQVHPSTTADHPSTRLPELEYVGANPDGGTSLTARSIVAIHGKGAHPIETWSTLRGHDLDRSDQANWINWLDDDGMLPAAYPTGRILRYGYRSDWFGEAAINTRAATIAEGSLDELQTAHKDALRRPLIFIAHSFGGLVVFKVSRSLQRQSQRTH
jgi:hypothetical protein